MGEGRRVLLLWYHLVVVVWWCRVDYRRTRFPEGKNEGFYIDLQQYVVYHVLPLSLLPLFGFNKTKLGL